MSNLNNKQLFREGKVIFPNELKNINLENITFGNFRGNKNVAIENIENVNQDLSKNAQKIIINRREKIVDSTTKELSKELKKYQEITGIMRMLIFLKALLTGHYHDNPKFIEFIEGIKDYKNVNNVMKNLNNSNIPRSVGAKTFYDFIEYYDEYGNKINQINVKNKLERNVGDYLYETMKDLIDEFKSTSLEDIKAREKDEREFLKFKSKIEFFKRDLSDNLDMLIKNYKSYLAGQYVIYDAEKDGKKYKKYERLFESVKSNQFGNSPTNSIIYQSFTNNGESEELGKKRLLGLKRYLKTASEKSEKYKKTENVNRWGTIKKMTEDAQRTTIYDVNKNKEMQKLGKINMSAEIKKY